LGGPGSSGQDFFHGNIGLSFLLPMKPTRRIRLTTAWFVDALFHPGPAAAVPGRTLHVWNSPANDKQPANGLSNRIGLL
jgi:hypothetical protein